MNLTNKFDFQPDEYIRQGLTVALLYNGNVGSNGHFPGEPGLASGY